jgi:hypothetical protein
MSAVNFKDIAIGQVFTFNSIDFRKVQPVKKTCCQLKRNAVQVSNNADAVFKPNDKVTRKS